MKCFEVTKPICDERDIISIVYTFQTFKFNTRFCVFVFFLDAFAIWMLLLLFKLSCCNWKLAHQMLAVPFVQVRSFSLIEHDFRKFIFFKCKFISLKPMKLNSDSDNERPATNLNEKCQMKGREKNCAERII